MAQLDWYELEGPVHNLKKFQRTGTKTGIYVKNGTLSSYMGIPGSEKGSFVKIALDCSIKYKECDEPTYEKAPCEQNVTRLHRHINICGKCKTINGGNVNRDGVVTSPKNIIKVAGLKTFNIEGMLPVLKEQEAHVEIILAEYKSMIETIERFPIVMEELLKAQRIIEEHKIAVTHFMKDINSEGYSIQMEHVNKVGGVPVIPTINNTKES